MNPLFNGKCNKKILQAHQLSGMDFSTFSTMRICPYVKDRCCSFADEIKIAKFYTERT